MFKICCTAHVHLGANWVSLQPKWGLGCPNRMDKDEGGSTMCSDQKETILSLIIFLFKLPVLLPLSAAPEREAARWTVCQHVTQSRDKVI